jgi:hypothetical protein
MKGVTGMKDQQGGPPDQHIVHQDGSWAVRPEGAQEPIRVFATQDEALQWAARSMNHQGYNLVVHNEDGSVNDVIRPES